MSILKKIEDAKRAVRESMERERIKGFPIIRSGGWRLIVADKSQDDWLEVCDGCGRITLKDVNRYLSDYPVGKYPNAAIEGSYDYVSHIDLHHEDYDVEYDNRKYWCVSIRGEEASL